MSGESVGRGAIQHLADLEQRIEDQAEALFGISGSQPAVAAMADELRARAREHRRVLEAARARVDAITPSLPDLPLVRALLPLFASLNEAVLAYAALHVLAHRAFDSVDEGNTADLAESHLRTHARTIHEIDVTISEAAVLESSEAGTECRCRCPACGLGLCLCSPHGANTVRQAWRETLPPAADGGLRIRPPRSGSEVHRAGLRPGERVIAIDGTEIASDLDTQTVQTAIRAHAPGDEIRLTVRAGERDTRDVRVRHP